MLRRTTLSRVPGDNVLPVTVAVNPGNHGALSNSPVFWTSPLSLPPVVVKFEANELRAAPVPLFPTAR